MADKYDAHWYYAAGILWFLNRQKQETFSITKLQDWSIVTGNDGYGTDFTEPLLVNKKLVDQALQLLQEFGVVDLVPDRYGPIIIKFHDDFGIDELADEFPDSPFERTYSHGKKWIQEAVIKINSHDGGDFETENDAIELKPGFSDGDDWEPLPINRNNPEYEDTIAGIELAIREIAADNGFSSTFPEERDNLVEHANTTLKFVKEGKVTRKQITENLIAAGKWIASKFTGTAIGFAGKSLMTWGLKLLGLL